MNEALQTNAAGDVLFETDGAIAIATLNRPQARNALTFAMYDRLAEICRFMRPEGEVRALIITGSGDRAFAAGTDISQFRAFRTEADAQAYEQNIESVLIATCSIAKADIWEVTKVNVWFIGVLLAVLLLITYVPPVPMALVDYFYH